MTDLILLRAEVLCLQYALHKARRDHKATEGLRKRLVPLVARVAAMESAA